MVELVLLVVVALVEAVDAKQEMISCLLKQSMCLNMYIVLDVLMLLVEVDAIREKLS